MNCREDVFGRFKKRFEVLEQVPLVIHAPISWHILNLMIKRSPNYLQPFDYA